MARVTLYSSSRRSHPVDRRAVLTPPSPASGPAEPEGTADTRDRRPRHGWITAGRRVEKPPLILGGVLVALGAFAVHSAPKPPPHTRQPAHIDARRVET